ncbi:unnamed protein product [Echinostoma caproni]|uniref:SCAN box domain-containing protein n=1 Tax=Echinostoma caproni TaxID=27848 RepID=A0A183B9K5_9TREM|nr:unnamed protein product [Echinostoma caproni]
MEYRKQFNARHQYNGEGVQRFVQELRRLASRAFENDWPAEVEKKLLEQLAEGSRSNNVRRHLLMNPPSDLEGDVKRAEDMEKLEAATAAPGECLAVGHDGAQKGQTSGVAERLRNATTVAAQVSVPAQITSPWHNRTFNYGGRQPGESKQKNVEYPHCLLPVK